MRVNSVFKILVAFFVIFGCVFLSYGQGTTSNWTTWKGYGNVQQLDSQCVMLTPAVKNQNGRIWFDQNLDLTQNFDLRVQLNFGNKFCWRTCCEIASNCARDDYFYPEEGGGADGIAFVIQTQSDQAGSAGEGIGYQNINPSLAVEFDPYYNYNNDPIYDHIAINVNGKVNSMNNQRTQGKNFQERDTIDDDLLGGITNSRGGFNRTPLLVPAKGVLTDPTTQAGGLHDGKDYEARFRWNATTKVFEVWWQCEKIIVLEEDIVNTIFSGSPSAYFGLTSATGSEFSVHTACLFRTPFTKLSADTTVCIGTPIQVDANVIDPPDQLTYEWNAIFGTDNSSISNRFIGDPILDPSSNHAIYTVEIETSCYPFDEPIKDTIEIIRAESKSSFVPPVIAACDRLDSLTIDFDVELDGIYDYAWIFDDGTFTDTTRVNFLDSVNKKLYETHTFSWNTVNKDSAIYDVILYKYDVLCMEDESDTFKISVGRPIELEIDADGPGNIKGCLPLVAELRGTINDSINLQYYEIDWDFGDSNELLNRPISDTVVSHTYLENGKTFNGTFKVRVISSHPFYDRYCVKEKVTNFTVQVDAVIPIDFDFEDPDTVHCAVGTTTEVILESTIQGTYDIKIDFGYNNDTIDFVTYRDGLVSFKYDYPNGGTYPVEIVYVDSVCQVYDTLDKVIIIPIVEELEFKLDSIDAIETCELPFEVTIEPKNVDTSLVDIYYWGDLNGNHTNQQEINPTFIFTSDVDTTIYFFGETTDKRFCVKKDTSFVKIKINKFPVLNPVFDIPEIKPCPEEGETQDLTVNIDVNATDVTPDSVAWSFGNFDTTTTALSYSHTYDEPGVYTISLIAYDPNGCNNPTYSEEVEFKIPDNLTLDLETIPNIEGCGPEFTAQPIAEVNDVVDSIFWSIEPNEYIHYGDTAPEIKFTEAGIYTVWFHAMTSDERYCVKEEKTSFTVEVKKFPEFDPQFQLPIIESCPDSGTVQDLTVRIDLGNSAVIPDSIVWSFGDTRDSITNVIEEMVYEYKEPGEYDLTAIAYDPNQCKNDTIAQTFVFKIPDNLTLDLEAIPNIEGCGPEFTAQPIAKVNDVVDSIFWSIKPNEYIHYGDTTPEIKFTEAGIYTVWFHAMTSDERYCVKEEKTSFTVEVNKFPVFDPQFQVPTIDPCPKPGEMQDLSVRIDLGNSAVIPDSVVWDFGDDTDSITTVIEEMVYEYKEDGIYEFVAIAYDPNHCKNDTIKQTFEFKIPHSLTLDAKVNDYIKGCSPYAASFFAETQGDVTQTSWDFGDGSPLLLDSLKPNHSYSETGLFKAVFIASTDDDRYCIKADTADVMVNIISKPEVDLEWSFDPPGPCEPGTIDQMEVELIAKPSRPLIDIVWTFGDSSDEVKDELIVTHTYTQVGTYPIHFIAFDTMCNLLVIKSDTATYQRGAILDSLIVPNIFTPNNDGLNDNYEITFKVEEGISDPEKYYFYNIDFFNRWGKRVFNSYKNRDGEEVLWNGEIDGLGATEGVYFYIIEFESTCTPEGDTVFKRQGHVTIVR